MTEPWIVFSLNGKDLAAYTVCGTFVGEAANTRMLLAAEHGCRMTDIKVRFENRKAGKKVTADAGPR